MRSGREWGSSFDTSVSALRDPEPRGAGGPLARGSGDTGGELAARAVLRVHTGDLLARRTAAR